MYSFAKILGQDSAQSHLKRAIEHGRTHHGYIFRGPEGVGKKYSALAFATLLNCSAREEFTFVDGCGSCPSCHKIQNLQHPDLLLIEPTGASKTIKIDEIRRISKFVRSHPFEARYQVIIINDAHRMTGEASNALLKTLEEPPAWVRMILVTHQPNNLLETIRSRGQFVRFQKLQQEHLKTLLKEIDLSEINPSTEELELTISLAEGSIERAISFLKDGVLKRRQMTFDILSTLNANKPKSISDASALFLKSKDRQHAMEFIDHIQLILRDIAGQQVGLLVSQNPLIVDVANHSHFDQIVDLKSTIDEAKKMIYRNGNTTLVFEWLMSEIADTFTSPNIH